MKTVSSPANPPTGIQGVPGAGMNNGRDPLAAIIGQTLETREARRLMITGFSEFLNTWAGNSWWKRLFSRFTGFVVTTQLSGPDDHQRDEISQLFKNEDFLKNVRSQSPALLQTLGEIVSDCSQGLNQLSMQDKQALIEGLMGLTIHKHTGRFLTNLAITLNDIHKEDPEYFARVLEPGFRQWVESTDFGELKEALEMSAEDARSLFEMTNSVMWNYPAKVVVLLSLIPSLANILSAGLQISLRKLNEVPPDLLTDIVLSFVNEIDTASLARLTNELAEIGRKLHTGSALLGEPGTPRLPQTLSDTLEAIVGQTDVDTFWKGRIAMAEIKDAFDLALLKAAESSPECIKTSRINSIELANIRTRARMRKLESWENLEDADLDAILGQCLTAYEIQTGAELFNCRLRLVNRAYQNQPGMCENATRQFIDSVDHEALAEAAVNVLTVAGDDLKDVAKPFVPGLVAWICETLRPSRGNGSGDDDNQDTAARARNALREITMAAEVN